MKFWLGVFKNAKNNVMGTPSFSLEQFNNENTNKRYYVSHLFSFTGRGRDKVVVVIGIVEKINDNFIIQRLKLQHCTMAIIYYYNL